MLTVNKDNRTYFKSSLLENTKGLSHCFTSRVGGESRGVICGLNLGFRVGDDPDSVKSNYMHIAEDFDFPYKNITAAKQIHSTNVRVITKEEAGCGVSRLSDTFEADALVTKTPELPIAVFYADCVPVLLADASAGVAAAVHSGWRGTVGRISESTISVMKTLGATAENIIAAIGPSIGPCCFETGGEVACEFDSDLCTNMPDGKFKVDLWEANRRILLECGVLPQNIEVLELCTMCNSDMLYSYRTHKEQTGRMGAFIMLKKD